MSLENVVIAISLMLGLVLMILIIYLISRVNDLETRTFAALSQAMFLTKTYNLLNYFSCTYAAEGGR